MDREHVNAKDTGAVGDGAHDDTEAVQRALDRCGEAGGGCAVLPPGTYHCRPLELRRGTALRLEQGAVLRASRDIEDYRGPDGMLPLISARDCTDVGIEGSGVIDCGADAFVGKDSVNHLDGWERRYTRQGTDYLATDAECVHGPYGRVERPAWSLDFNDCTGVRVEGVTITQSSPWTIRIARCRSVAVRGVRIDNDMAIPNSDGVHVTCCRDVVISDCRITAGDDAIALTTVSALHGAPEGFDPTSMPLENCVVTNCVLRSRSSGVRIGYGPADLRRIALSNLVICDSNRGIGIFARNGGSIRDVTCSNCVIETDLVAGHWWGAGEPIHVSCVPAHRLEGHEGGVGPFAIENVRFTGITARSSSGAVIYAEPTGTIRNVSVEGLDLRLRPSDLHEAVGGNYDLRPVDDPSLGVFGRRMPALWARGADGLRLRNISVQRHPEVPEWLTEGVELEECSRVTTDGLP